MTAKRATKKTAAKKAPVQPRRPGPRYDAGVGGIATDDGGRPLVDDGGRPIRKDA